MYKLKFILLLILVNSIMFVSGQSSIITKTITPAEWSHIPVVKSEHIKGGIHYVKNIADTSSIIKERRENGMFCYVNSTNEFFQLIKNRWEKVLLNVFLKDRPAVPDTGSLYYNRFDKRYEYYDGAEWNPISEDGNINNVDANILRLNPNTTSYEGVTSKMDKVLNSTLVIYKPIYVSGVGIYGYADCTIYEKSRCVGMVISDSTILNYGYVTNSSWNWTVGKEIYLNKEEFSHTRPNSINDYVQVLGYAVSSKILFFEPNSVIKKNVANLIVIPTKVQILSLYEDGIPLEAVESPQATSRAWYYGISATGPYQNPINNGELLSYTPKYEDFASLGAGVKYIVCKSDFNGKEVVSPPIKILFGDIVVIPKTNQILQIKQNGAKLYVTTNPSSTTNKWLYGVKSGGPYNNILVSGIEYTPSFEKKGTYFIVCKSEIDGTIFMSNEVRFDVSTNQIAPTTVQYVREGSVMKKISNVVSGLKTQWLYGATAEGPFNKVIPKLTYSLEYMLPVGVHFVVSDDGGSVSNPVNVNVITKTITPNKKIILNAGKKGAQIEYSVKPKPDFIRWSYRLESSNSWNLFSLGKIFEPIYDQTGRYYLKAEAIYGAITIESDEIEVEVVSFKISPTQTQFLNKGYYNKRLKSVISPSSIAVTPKWFYGTDYASMFSFDSENFEEQFNSIGIFHVFSRLDYNSQYYFSDTVDIKVADVRIVGGNKITPLDQSLTFTAIDPNGVNNKWDIIAPDGKKIPNISNTKQANYNFTALGIYKLIYSTEIYNHIYADTIIINVTNVQITNKSEYFVAEKEFIETLITSPNTAGEFSWYSSRIPNDVISQTQLVNQSRSSLYQYFFKTAGVYYVHCIKNGARSNEVKINVIGNIITTESGLDKQFVKTNDATAIPLKLNLTGNIKPDAIRWYRGTDPNQINDPIQGSAGAKELYIPNLPKGRHYITCKCTYGSKVIESSNNIPVYSVESILKGYDEQILKINTDGPKLNVDVRREHAGYKWYYKNSDVSPTWKIIIGSIRNFIYPNFEVASTSYYYIRCETIYEGGFRINSNVYKMAVPVFKIEPAYYQLKEVPCVGDKLTVVIQPEVPGIEYNWYSGYYYREDLMSFIKKGGKIYLPKVGDDSYKYKIFQCRASTLHGTQIASNSVGVGMAHLVEVDGAWKYSDGYIPENAAEYLTPKNPRLYKQSTRVNDWYWIDFDGDAGSSPAVKVFCNMANGGWMRYDEVINKIYFPGRWKEVLKQLISDEELFLKFASVSTQQKFIKAYTTVESTSKWFDWVILTTHDFNQNYTRDGTKKKAKHKKKLPNSNNIMLKHENDILANDGNSYIINITYNKENNNTTAYSKVWLFTDGRKGDGIEFEFESMWFK